MDAKPYSWQELKHKWQHEQLNNEQMIGQLLVWCELLHNQLVTIQRQLEGRLKSMEVAVAHTGEERQQSNS